MKTSRDCIGKVGRPMWSASLGVGLLSSSLGCLQGCNTPPPPPPPCDAPPCVTNDRDTVKSTFDANDDGWTVVGGPFAVPTRPVHETIGGSPGAHVSAKGNRANGFWYWLAPEKFYGDVTAAYGHSLTFELNQEFTDFRVSGDQLVVLTGLTTAVYYDAPYIPGVTWTSYSARLHENEPWFDSETGQRATAAQILAVLADLQELWIRGWFSFDEGTGGLDNVVLNLRDNPPPKPPGVSVISTFDAGDAGWTVADGSFRRTGPLIWNETDGNPDGHISATGSHAWYWIAPPTFHGNMSGAYGRTLAFDLNQEFTDFRVGIDQLVVLNGGGSAVYLNAPYKPAVTWTSYSVRLDETEQWFSYVTGQRASHDEMLAILSNLQQLQIRGWFSLDEGTGGLDNVILQVAEPVTPEPTGNVTSSFDVDDEDWAVAGGSFRRSGPATWNETEGNPDGHIFATGSDAWYWIASPKFRGDRSQAYGQTLDFDLNQEFTDFRVGLDQLVVLNGGGYAVYFDAPYKPSPTWTSYSIRLDETERWINAATGQRMTRSQMQQLLSNLQQLKIRGWFSLDEGTGGLDNVVLNQAP